MAKLKYSVGDKLITNVGDIRTVLLSFDGVVGLSLLNQPTAMGLILTYDQVEKDGYKKVEPETHKFKIGDRVQFKTWEEMKKEYGVDEYGNIDNISFGVGMKHLCGTYATIYGFYNDIILLKDFTATGQHDCWIYSKEMLKPATNEPKWYENIPTQGILCWVWDIDESINKVYIIERIDNLSSYKFITKCGGRYLNAKPLTAEEVKQFIL